ncbi:long-chain-fatty-acid--CoA ligase ACSBG2 isoform X2 [Eurytemora carolleeae]|uniref:long-chain-fatty-acid--CoA ligase ACSBG2 isoform X2 n=1 Tax=Eurytemora carolleeae TaxID=1294199 RepID=UPI000C78751F|nr:long-chain-fatty-acid--CoA ligase ACSBG2 isoform X2 [Eurytemora carolleeae]|eukprot:XP_023339812.1 long-chain-fatty-acid--CoA ligase ACSBG2-like isoform X2 [Eurytemora affinis]
MGVIRVQHFGRYYVTGSLLIRNNKNIKTGRSIHTSLLYNNNISASTSNRLGPDRVLPASSLTTTWPDGVVEIRTNNHPSSRWKPKSVWTMLNDTLARVPDRTALAVKRDGIWVTWSFTEYINDIRSVAKAFINLGLKQHHAVNIIGFNAPEWHISNIASVVAGGLATGIYTTNSQDSVRYVAQHSRANIIVLEDQEQLDKILNIQDQLKELQCIVQYSGTPTVPGVLSWEELLDIGRGLPDSVLQERLAMQAINQPCMLVYTSGTTGNPKGVMISQDNITWTVNAVQGMYDWKMDCEHGISYLPLSHVAAQIIDIYLSAYGGATISFADKEALQGSLINTLKEVNPTKFLGVPRVWEKIEEKLKELGKNNSGIKKTVMDWAKNAALQHHTDKMAGKRGQSISYTVARWLILRKIHAALGLEVAGHPDNNGGFFSSAAPLSPQTFQYFLSLDMPILELLGSSETGGPQTACLPGAGMRVGSVGRSYPHFETVILKPDKDGIGEICTRGRNVCMGYLWDEEKTKELIDEDGWVHSGDLGRIDEDGFIYVCGRMKELIITGGGENIAPVPIEDLLRAELEEICSHVMVIGDARNIVH